MRKGVAEQDQGIDGRRAVQLVHGDRGSGRLAFDVDLGQDFFDRRLVGRAGIGGQAAGVLGVRRQLGHRHRGGQHTQGGGGQDVFRRVDRRHGGFLRRWTGVQAVDHVLDIRVVSGRSPGHELADFGAQQEAGAGERLGQQADRIAGRRGRCLTFQLVDDDLRASAALALDVDLGQGGGDFLLVGRAGQDRQSLGIGGIRGDRGFGHRRLQHGRCAGGGDRLERVQGDLGRVLRRRGGVQLVDHRLDPGVVFFRGPGDELVGFRSRRERGFGERGAEHGQRVVQRSGCGSSFELVDPDRRAPGRIAGDVDLFQDVLDCGLIDRAGKRRQAARVFRVRCQLGFRDRGGQQGDRAGGRDVLQRVHRGFGSFLRRRAGVQAVDHVLDVRVVFGRSPGHNLADLGAQQEAGAGKCLGQQADRVAGRRGRRLPLQLVDNDLRASAALALDVDLGQCSGDLLLVGRAGQDRQSLGIGGIRGDRGFGHRRLQHGRCAGGGDRLERVQGDLGRVLRRRGGVQLVDHRLDPGVVFFRGPGDELVGFRSRRECGFGERGAEHGQGVVQRTGGRGSFELVHDDRRLAAGLSFDVDFGQDRLDILVFRRPSGRGQPLRIGRVGGKGRAGHRRLQHGQRAGGGDRFQRIQGDLDHVLGCRRRVQAIDQGLDASMVLGRGPGDELARVGAEGEIGVGKGRAKHVQSVHHGRRRGLVFQPVDHDRRLGAGRAFDVDLLQDGSQHLLVARLGHGDHLAGVRTGGDFGGGHGGGQHGQRRGGGDVLQRVRLGAGLARGDLRLGHLLDRLADRLLVFRRGPSGQAAGLGVHGDAGRRHQAGEHQHQGLRIGVAAGVDDQLRFVLVIRTRLQLVDGLGDGRVIRFAGPSEDPAGLGIRQDLGLGQLLLQDRDGDLGRDFGQRVRLQLQFKIAGRSAAQLFQRGLDLRVVLGSRPDEDAPRLGVDHELGVGEQAGQEGGNRGGIGDGAGVRRQLQLLGLGRLLLQLLDQFGDLQLFAGAGPDGQRAGIVVGQDLQARHVRLQRRQDGLKPFLLSGRDRVDHQLARLLGRRAGFKLFDDLLDRVVIGGGGHGDQPFVGRVGGDLGVGHHFFQDVQQSFGGLVGQGMKADRGRPAGAAGAGLQLFERAADQLLVGGHGQRDQAAGLGVQGQLGIRDDFLEQGQRGIGVGLDQSVHLQLRRVLGRGALAQSLQRLGDGLVLFLGRPDDQVLDLAVDRKTGVGNQGLQRGDQRAGFGGGRETEQRIRLEPRLLVGGRFGFQLFDRGRDRGLICGRGPDQQAFVGRIEGDLGLGKTRRQHRHQAGRIGRRDRVRGQFGLGSRRRLLELLEGQFDGRLAGRRRQHQQAFPFLVHRDLGLGGDLGEQVQHVGGRRLLERIELQLGRFRIGRVGPQFLQRRLDPLMISGRGDGDQPLLRGVRGELGQGDHLSQQRLGRGQVGAAQGIDLDGAAIAGGPVQAQLFQRRLDQLLFGRRAVDDQAFGLGVRADLGFRDQRLDLGGHRVQGGGGFRADVIGLEPRLIRARRFALGLDLQQGGSDRLLVAWFGQRDQAAGPLVVAQLGVGNQLFQHRDQLGRIDAGQAIDLQLRRLDRIADGAAPQLVHRGADRLVFGGRGPGDHGGSVFLERDERLGNEGFEHLGQFRRGRGGGHRLGQLVQFHAAFAIGGRGGRGLDLVQHRLDLGVLGRGRVGVHLVQIRVHDELDAAHQLFQQLHLRFRVHHVDRIDLQLLGFRFRRRGRRGGSLRFRQRLDDLLHIGHDARPVGDEQLSGRDDGQDRVVGSQQRLDGRDGRDGIAAAQRELDSHQLVLAAFLGLFDRHLGDQAFGKLAGQIDQGQHAFAANQRIAFGQQDAVQQIERLGHRVIATIGIVERSRRGRVQHERQVGLLGEPLQDVRPALVAEIEPQAFFGVGRSRIGRCGAGFGCPFRGFGGGGRGLSRRSLGRRLGDFRGGLGRLRRRCGRRLGRLGSFGRRRGGFRGGLGCFRCGGRFGGLGSFSRRCGGFGGGLGGLRCGRRFGGLGSFSRRCGGFRGGLGRFGRGRRSGGWWRFRRGCGGFGHGLGRIRCGSGGGIFAGRGAGDAGGSGCQQQQQQGKRAGFRGTAGEGVRAFHDGDLRGNAGMSVIGLPRPAFVASSAGWGNRRIPQSRYLGIERGYECIKGQSCDSKIRERGSVRTDSGRGANFVLSSQDTLIPRIGKLG